MARAQALLVKGKVRTVGRHERLHRPPAIPAVVQLTTDATAAGRRTSSLRAKPTVPLCLLRLPVVLFPVERLSVRITLHPKARRRFDLDNRPKVLLGALVQANGQPGHINNDEWACPGEHKQAIREVATDMCPR